MVEDTACELPETVTSTASPAGTGRPEPRIVPALIGFCGRHWLAGANILLLVFSSLPVLDPLLAAAGQTGIAARIFQAYALTCHQMPSRSYFILGHQMAYCERNTAIYFSMTLAGLVYAIRRGSGGSGLSLRAYFLLILPIAIDGFTQLFGWRESTWYLRTITGALFGGATIWLTFPYLQESIDQIREWTELVGRP